MADSPAPAYNAMGQLQPSVTTYGPTSSTTTKKPSKEDAAALAALEQADAEQRTALQGLPPTPQAPDQATVEAEIASREQSALATPKTDTPREGAAWASNVLDQATGKTPPAPDMASPEAPRYTSQQMAAAPEVQPPKTFEQAQDESAADKARYQAKLQAETQANLEAIDRERQQRLDASMRNINALSAQLANGGSIQPYHPSLAQRFGLALGALGAGLTGGENTAARMLEKQMDQDMEAQKERIRVSSEQLRMAGALPQQIAEYAKQRTEHALAMEKAKLDTFAAQTDTLLAPFPQFQVKAQQIIANTKATQAQKIFDNVKDITGSSTTSERSHTVTVTGKPDAQGSQGDKTSEGLKLAGLEAVKGIAAEFAKTGGPTAESLSTARSNAEGIAAGRKIAEEGLGGRTKADLGRFLGIIPENAAKGMAHEEGKNVLDARKFFQNVAGAMVNRGMLDPSQIDAQVDQWVAPLYSASRDEAKAFWQDWSSRIGGATAVSPKRAEKVMAGMRGTEVAPSPSTPTAQSKFTPAELGKLNAHEKAQYFEARLEKPGSPDYADAQRAIQSLTARARAR